jgi:uridine kinase
MDGFAFESMKSRLLEPFATGAAFVLRTYDIEREQAVEQELVVAGMAPVLVVDGVFLLRSEIRACWDLAVYLRVSRATSIERGVARDGARSGEVLLERRLYEQRYAPAQDLYHEEVSPEDRADVVIDYEDLGHPVVVRG